MGLLDTIQTGRQNRPPRLLLHGGEGVGKSTFASKAPDPIFIQTEDGLDALDVARFPLSESFGAVMENLAELSRADHDYKTIVIDSIDWLQTLIFEDLCNQYGVTGIEKVDGGYGRGYTHALNQWQQVTQHLDGLRNSKGMVVILIAHSKVERFEDPESDSYDRFVPRLNKHAGGMLTEWADAVLFATQRIRLRAEDSGFNKTRNIAKPIGAGGGERILKCVGAPSHVAKNRYGIVDELPLEWDSFVNAVKEKQGT